MTQIIIVSGRSGSGKTSVINTLEDFGYYCIDNLPLSLICPSVDTLSNDGVHKIALGVDIRLPNSDLSDFCGVYDALSATYGDKVKILYTTASDAVLIARFGATRRSHPLMTGDHAVSNLPQALAKERDLLSLIVRLADITLDTSSLNTHELKEQIRRQLGVESEINTTILSFGFKYGVPLDADFVFDVRTLPNPHWDIALRAQTGLDLPVQTFFAKYPEIATMTDDIAHFLNKHLPAFLHNNRHMLTIAIGCTGGKHRSVFVADTLAKSLKQTLPKALNVTAKHRDKKYW